MQQQREQDEKTSLWVQMPKTMLIFANFIFYFCIIGYTLILFGGGRAILLAMLPLYLLLIPLMFIYGYWIRLGTRRVPVYVVDEEGITDRMSFPHGTVTASWDEIAGVAPTNWAGFAGLKVHLKNPKAFLVKQNLPHRIMGWINQICYGTPLALWKMSSDVPLDELEAAIKARLH
jgi:hypothetical protein